MAFPEQLTPDGVIVADPPWLALAVPVWPSPTCTLVVPPFVEEAFALLFEHVDELTGHTMAVAEELGSLADAVACVCKHVVLVAWHDVADEPAPSVAVAVLFESVQTEPVPWHITPIASALSPLAVAVLDAFVQVEAPPWHITPIAPALSPVAVAVLDESVQSELL